VLLGAALALAAALTWPAAAMAQAPSSAIGPFLADLTAQNAHHLRDRPAIPPEAPTPVLEPAFDAAPKTTRWSLAAGALDLEVTIQSRTDETGRSYTVPALAVFVAKRKVFTLDGAEGFGDIPVFLVQIAEMDPANAYPEIVFSTYTGGAHCCSDTRIVTSSPDGGGWRAVETGMFDGEPLRAEDADGDGRFELVAPDDHFLYKFACYACSNAPLRIQRLEGARMADVGREPRYRARQVAWLIDMIERVGDPLYPNAYLAGYIAQKILLGEGEGVWAFILKHYDRTSDWGLEDCSVDLDRQGNCPGEMLKLSYPDALRRFLAGSGYPPPD